MHLHSSLIFIFLMQLPQQLLPFHQITLMNHTKVMSICIFTRRLSIPFFQCENQFFRSQTNHHTVTYILYLQHFDFVMIFTMKTLSEKHDWMKARIAKSKDVFFIFIANVGFKKKCKIKQNYFNLKLISEKGNVCRSIYFGCLKFFNEFCRVLNSRWRLIHFVESQKYCPILFLEAELYM